MRTATDRTKSSSLIGAALIAAAAAIGVAPAAHAGTIAQCEQAVRASPFSIFLNGSTTEAGGGQLKYNATTGAIWLDLKNIRGGSVELDPEGNPRGPITWNAGNGTMINVDWFNGNADPILGFQVGTSTGATGTTVGFVFNLPIALAGLVAADARVSYSLTSLSEDGATISPIAGRTHIVDAFDLDAVGSLSPAIDKGVDVGDEFSVPAFASQGTPGGYSSPVNFFMIDTTYDVMRVHVDYSLTPMSFLGVTGFVRQVVVPLPAALPLLLAGLAGFGAVARRRAAIV